MKSYTNLEQSKMLAEILSIESADMFYYKDAVTKEDNPRVMNFLQVPKSKTMYYSPCWSLAALLNILPDTITSNDGIAFKLNIKKNIIEYSNPSLYLIYKSVKSDNFVDACVEMIEKLHEQNLI